MPPSFNILTLNAFIASNKVLVPIQSEYLALQGLSEIIEIINKVKKRINKDLELGGFIMTRYDSRKVLNKHIAEEIKKRFKEKVFKTKIRDNVAIAEAPMKGLDIFRYNENSHGAIDYLELSKEVLNLIK